jgi:tryptophanyl-tRNA synthetase
MAADILVYRATHVPVGEDQVQHLELTRDLVDQFNRAYPTKSSKSTVFLKPATVLNSDTKRIMSLFDPTKKMSKSEPKIDSRILLSDTPDMIRKKISRATTDSLGMLDQSNYSNRPGVSNLISILAACSNVSEEKLRQECHGMDLATFKGRVTESVVSLVEPIRSEIERLRQDQTYIERVLKEGKYKAIEAAEETMVQVRDVVGLTI